MLLALASPMIFHPPQFGINLAKIDLVSAWHLKERSQVTERKHVVKILEIPFRCRGDYMYFYTHTRSGKLNRIDVSHTIVTKISFGKGTILNILNVLIVPLECVYYLHTIHSVELNEIVGVESSRCNLVPRPPNQKLLPTPLTITLICQTIQEHRIPFQANPWSNLTKKVHNLFEQVNANN